MDPEILKFLRSKELHIKQECIAKVISILEELGVLEFGDLAQVREEDLKDSGEAYIHCMYQSLLYTCTFTDATKV